MKTQLLGIFLLMLFGQVAAAQSTEEKTFIISITDSTALNHITHTGNNYIPVFNNEAINSVISGYTITEWRQEYPGSTYPELRHVWRVTANSLDLGTALINGWGTLFCCYESLQMRYPKSIAFTPNDWYNFTNGQGYLDFIRARQAWDISKGDPKILIGVEDTYFDLARNPDLKTKVQTALDNTFNPYPGNNIHHGTRVAGLVAGATNNVVGYPAIGFNSKMIVSTLGSTITGSASETNRKMAVDYHARVLNSSWYNAYAVVNGQQNYYSNNEQKIYNEIYENGTVSVFGAGNGDSIIANTCYACLYMYPASLDHNISVSNAGWENPVGGSNLHNQQGVYENDYGDSVKCFQRNDRVDLCAPSLNIGGLRYDETDTSIHYTGSGNDGTSFGSPIVAGTVGLMLAKQDCLSPWQVEWILKTAAKKVTPSFYSIGTNANYIGRLGAGRLDAYETLKLADANALTGISCNNDTLQTMYIEGITFNTKCAPGSSSNSVLPQFKVIIRNGVAPFTYRWEPIENGTATGNQTGLSSYTSSNPQITSAYGNKIAYYYLTVYDASEVQKVAHKKVRITLTDVQKEILAMRDAYTDMLDEPNSMSTVDARDWDIWHSPDIWNRLKRDDSTAHQNPEYFSSTTDSNFMYVRILNVGCLASPIGAGVEMYWTKASTGEHWPLDWTSSTVGGAGGNQIAAGGRITPDPAGFGLLIPSIQPGDTTLISQAWRPIQPELYDTAANPTMHSVDVCGLARIRRTISGYTFAYPEVAQTKINVLNNNNIVTRNMTTINLGRAHARMINHFVDVASVENDDQYFSLQMLTDKNIHPYLAGNISEYMYVSVNLGSLFDRWIDGGARGNYASINYDSKTVTYDPATPLQLDNILLRSGERFPVEIIFQLKDVDVPFDIIDRAIFFRLLWPNAEGREKTYGAFAFNINIEKDEVRNGQRQTNPSEPAVLMSGNYKVYPNPISQSVNIQYNGKSTVAVVISVLDMTGRIVIKGRSLAFKQGQLIDLNTSLLSSGNYILSIAGADGQVQTFKLTKQ